MELKQMKKEKQTITELYLYEALNDHYEGLKSILTAFNKGYTNKDVTLRNLKNLIEYNYNLIQSRLNQLNK